MSTCDSDPNAENKGIAGPVSHDTGVYGYIVLVGRPLALRPAGGGILLAGELAGETFATEKEAREAIDRTVDFGKLRSLSPAHWARDQFRVFPVARLRAGDQRDAWPEIVDEIRRKHNGVFGVNLFFGHDGHNACVFNSYEKQLARGESGRSMQEAVERCVQAWHNSEPGLSYCPERLASWRCDRAHGHRWRWLARLCMRLRGKS